MVADGLGGHGGGQIASSVAADAVTRLFIKTPSTDAGVIRGLFEAANAEVVKAQTPGQKMKSTGVALFAADGTVIWAHAGDSRLYHFINGALVFQTLDHSVSQMAVFAGEITKDEIRCHADRNRVLKAFGDEEGFRSEISAAVALRPGSHAFLLCTDGFWEYVLEPEMELELAKRETPHDWLEAMVQRIVQRAPKDNDNYSAAAVFINVETEK
jgi:serine/threonine protein phosphatase PrpC